MQRFVTPPAYRDYYVGLGFTSDRQKEIVIDDPYFTRDCKEKRTTFQPHWQWSCGSSALYLSPLRRTRS